MNSKETIDTVNSVTPSGPQNAVKWGSYLAPQMRREITDIARLRVAVRQLRADGYVVLDGGCCPSCNWADIHQNYPDAVNVVQFDDQCLDAAFGAREPTPEWRGYLDAAADNEDESERRHDEWLSHWDDDEHPAAQRPGMLSDSLWIQHEGDAARAVDIMRSARCLKNATSLYHPLKARQNPAARHPAGVRISVIR
jgi:hypothetical protein